MDQTQMSYIATCADGGVGERKELAYPVPALDDVDEGSLVGGTFVGGQATPLRHDFVEREGDDLSFDRSLRRALRDGLLVLPPV